MLVCTIKLRDFIPDRDLASWRLEESSLNRQQQAARATAQRTPLARRSPRAPARPQANLPACVSLRRPCVRPCGRPSAATRLPVCPVGRQAAHAALTCRCVCAPPLTRPSCRLNSRSRTQSSDDAASVRSLLPSSGKLASFPNESEPSALRRSKIFEISRGLMLADQPQCVGKLKLVSQPAPSAKVSPYPPPAFQAPGLGARAGR